MGADLTQTVQQNYIDVTKRFAVGNTVALGNGLQGKVTQINFLNDSNQVFVQWNDGTAGPASISQLTLVAP